jgi:hypothetical protein
VLRSARFNYGRLARWAWPARFPIVQWPNAPLLVALAASVTGRLTHGVGRTSASSVFYVALSIWAYEELARGVNWFRRLLGAAVLVYIVVHLATALND